MRPAGQSGRQRRGVVDLQPELRDAARVAEGVGDPQAVPDVARELVDGVAGLQVGQPQAGQDVGAADDEDRQVDEIEEVVPAGRERGDDQHRPDEQELEPAASCRAGRGWAVSSPSEDEASSLGRWLGPTPRPRAARRSTRRSRSG